MRGQEEYNFGMSAGPSVRKGKTAKQVRRARRTIDAAKKTTVRKPEIRTNNTSARKAYSGQKVTAPKKNLSSSGRFMQSADTRESVRDAYRKIYNRRRSGYSRKS